MMAKITIKYNLENKNLNGFHQEDINAFGEILETFR